MIPVKIPKGSSAEVKLLAKVSIKVRIPAPINIVTGRDFR